MKKTSFLFLALCAMLFMASCTSGDKKKVRDDRRSEYLRPASMYYSHEDTANIQSLVGQYVELFKNKEFDAASQMLYKVRNDSVFPLEEAERKGFVRAMSSLQVYDARQHTLLLRSDRNNEVKLMVQIRPDGSLDEERGIIMFALNPVLYEGQWYLTLLDKHAEGVQEIYFGE